MALLTATYESAGDGVGKELGYPILPNFLQLVEESDKQLLGD